MTTPIYTVASGKGGVGKTSLVINLCHILAAEGKKVLLLDADFGLANADVQLALAPEVDLAQVISGKIGLGRAVTTVTKNFDLIAGRSGNNELAFMAGLEQQEILTQLRALSVNYDVVFLDAAAGLDATTLALCTAADKTLLITTPDPSSITDAYAVVKLLKQRQSVENCALVINQASKSEGARVAEKVQAACKNFLAVDVPLLAVLSADKQYAMAVKLQSVAAVAFPACDVVGDLKILAGKLV